MWEDMGEKNFRKLQSLGILKLPSKRQLDRIKAKTPSNAGCEPAAFDMLRSVVDQQQRSVEDREVLLAWDAMGYNAGISYDKNTGRLLGYTDDFQFGLCVQRYANKVNVLTVISPQKGIKLSFPIAHYHVNTLTRCIIIACMYVNAY